MSLLLVLVGALFGALFLLNNFIKALARTEKVSFFDLLLTFLTTLLFVSALIVDGFGWLSEPPVDFIPAEAPNAAILPLVRLAAGGLAAASLIIVLVELFRPWRLARSRGLLGLFSGGLIALSTLTVPFSATYFALQQPTPAPIAVVAVSPTADASDSGEFVAVDDRAADLFKAIRDVLRDEIEADEVEVFTRLDSGTPLAAIVTENGGDLDRVVERLANILRENVRDSVDNGEINTLQGALLISQMETFVRIAVNSNLNTLGRRFGEPTPTGTRQSLLTLLTETPSSLDNTPAATPTAGATMPPAPTATATLIPNSPTPSPTRSPQATITALATITPRPTREPFATRTPLPTATEPTPCLATVEYNLRLREAPNTDAETLLVIPFTSVIMLYGRSSDGAWWLAEFESQRGWVDGQYLTLSSACTNLPVR